MDKGIVMEVLSSGNVIVLTKDGQFLSVKPHSKVEIGEEASFKLLEKDRQYQAIFANHKIRWIASVAAIFLLLLVGIPGWFGLDSNVDKVAAYVTVDINPSVEIAISSKETVLQIEGINEDGKKLVQTIRDSIIGIPVAQATSILLQESEKLGYIKANAEVVISTTRLIEDQTFEKNIEDQVKRAVADQLKKVTNVSITTVETTAQVREDAQKSGLSTGKYAIYLMTKNKNQEISIDRFKNQSISEIAKDRDDLKQILGKNITAEIVEQWHDKQESKNDEKEEKKELKDQGGKQNKNDDQKVDHKKDNGKNEEKQEVKIELNQKRTSGNKQDDEIKNDRKEQKDDRNKKDEKDKKDNEKNDGETKHKNQ
ncbi:anti-sigma factor domain-containing protein [Tepidibacillus infernus]|uniref:anti-sigma factor domain-containing protein n=1 Tax=Tepidibacillus infernus TaxID=1806172 RepID=UPI003B7550EB